MLNGCVERAPLTHTEEYYEVIDGSFDSAELKVNLLVWEKAYNTSRPYQSLGYLTHQDDPECYLRNKRKEVICHSGIEPAQWFDFNTLCLYSLYQFFNR